VLAATLELLATRDDLRAAMSTAAREHVAREHGLDHVADLYAAALEEAAASLGALWWRRFTRVTLPLVWPGAIAGTLLAFVIALGEYVASVLVFVPTNRPISIAIASELRDFNLGTAAAYGVVLMLMIAVIMIVATRLERRS